MKTNAILSKTETSAKTSITFDGDLAMTAITNDLIQDIRASRRTIKWTVILTGLVITVVQTLLIWYLFTGIGTVK